MVFRIASFRHEVLKKRWLSTVKGVLQLFALACVNSAYPERALPAMQPLWKEASQAPYADTLPSPTGRAVFIQDPILDEVLARRTEYNRKAATSLQGYRVLLYAGTQRKEAYNVQWRLREAFPDQETYLSFQFPNFKVFVGDFHLAEDAAKLASTLKNSFADERPIVISQKINPAKAKD